MQRKIYEEVVHAQYCNMPRDNSLEIQAQKIDLAIRD